MPFWIGVAAAAFPELEREVAAHVVQLRWEMTVKSGTSSRRRVPTELDLDPADALRQLGIVHVFPGTTQATAYLDRSISSGSCIRFFAVTLKTMLENRSDTFRSLFRAGKKVEMLLVLLC